MSLTNSERTASSTRDAKIAISWSGLPQYAARLIHAAMDQLNEPCNLIATKPLVPVDGMERLLGQGVHWVADGQPTSWAELGLSVPQIFVQSGWSLSPFNSLGHEVKAAGGHVIGLSDANWRGDLRQLVLGRLAFSICYLRHFDAVLVPGQQGEKLMRYFGMRRDRIRQGMYAADHSLFSRGPPLNQRNKKFLFVGQFIPRKNIIGLCNAFAEFSQRHPEWSLHICGSGVQRDEIPSHPQILVEDFVQPEHLSERFHQARFLVLPSHSEAWGLVVHEATLCGCALVLSDAIGSGADLATTTNSICFNARSEGELVRALESAASRDSQWLSCAEAESLKLSSLFSPQRFAAELGELIDEIRRH